MPMRYEVIDNRVSAVGHKQEGFGEKIRQWRYHGGILHLHGLGVWGD